MKPVTPSNRLCRHCRYYIPEGRRGGHCQQLNEFVQGGWTACSLAIPPFAPAWENLQEIMRWQEKTLGMQPTEAAQPTPEEVIAPAATLRPTVGIRALWM